MTRLTGAVVVAPQYRLGVFGFWAANASVPKNYGLEDQIFALAWTARNAAAFGGDAGKLMILGVSAGGASVAYLLSAASPTPIAAAAMESPGGHQGWMNPDGPRDDDDFVDPAVLAASSAAVAFDVNCTVDDVACLRAVDADELLAAAADRRLAPAIARRRPDDDRSADGVESALGLLADGRWATNAATGAETSRVGGGGVAATTRPLLGPSHRRRPELRIVRRGRGARGAAARKHERGGVSTRARHVFQRFASFRRRRRGALRGESGGGRILAHASSHHVRQRSRVLGAAPRQGARGDDVGRRLDVRIFQAVRGAAGRRLLTGQDSKRVVATPWRRSGSSPGHGDAVATMWMVPGSRRRRGDDADGPRVTATPPRPRRGRSPGRRDAAANDADARVAATPRPTTRMVPKQLERRSTAPTKRGSSTTAKATRRSRSRWRVIGRDLPCPRLPTKCWREKQPTARRGGPVSSRTAGCRFWTMRSRRRMRRGDRNASTFGRSGSGTTSKDGWVGY